MFRQSSTSLSQNQKMSKEDPGHTRLVPELTQMMGSLSFTWRPDREGEMEDLRESWRWRLEPETSTFFGPGVSIAALGYLARLKGSTASGATDGGLKLILEQLQQNGESTLDYVNKSVFLLQSPMWSGKDIESMMENERNIFET
ncbi:putative nuclear export protein [Steelhead trout orthomyxovirus-1]|uniref:Nuclear export protein n=1 Tax=Steelhead trout orthomyxovirus-1 TaxID=1954186 RepID=A0A1Q1MMF3_9ORTO|nr:putative nuclear export protein [Steelhead trout orthomyxovirus-1]